jgi:hypothetical protein
MKHIKTSAILAGSCIALLSLSACLKAPESTYKTSNQEIKVELLFEHDGVKVYRFYDGRTIYYTDARGKTSWSETHSNGKSSSIITHDVETVR